MGHKILTKANISIHRQKKAMPSEVSNWTVKTESLY